MPSQRRGASCGRVIDSATRRNQASAPVALIGPTRLGGSLRARSVQPEGLDAGRASVEGQPRDWHGLAPLSVGENAAPHHAKADEY